MKKKGMSLTSSASSEEEDGMGEEESEVVEGVSGSTRFFLSLRSSIWRVGFSFPPADAGQTLSSVAIMFSMVWME